MSHARFTKNSLYKHIFEMALSSTVGLLAIFVVDVIDIYFMAQLGPQQVAGVGLASTLLIFTIALGVGLSVTMGVKVAHAIGAGDLERAANYKNYVYLYTVLINLIVIVLVYPFIRQILSFLGAHGPALDYGVSYLQIILPSTILLTLSMNGTALLRAVGKPNQAMLPPFVFAITNVLCTPILMFACDWGVPGGAFSEVIGRIASLSSTLYLCHKYCHLKAAINWRGFLQSLKPISAIALPAILTSLANPLANFITMREIAKFGHSAVVGFSIISRLIPVAFTILLSTHSSLGPIFSQNYGAQLFPRVKETLIKAAIFCTGIVLIAALTLNLLNEPINQFFGVDVEAQALITFFCKDLAIWYLGLGLLFIALTGFNSLGKAQYATYLNFGRATLGTIPFVVIGGQIGGPIGLLIGQTLGNTLFGIASFIWCYLYVKKLSRPEQVLVLVESTPNQS